MHIIESLQGRLVLVKKQIMSSDFKQFKALHHQETPLLLGNVWNVQSARIFEKLGFQAIGTSSAAVAETLGYRDGEQMPFEDYFFLIRRIRESTPALLSVDLEAGYGATDKAIIENLKRLYDLGIAGINIEDSIVDDAGREIVSADNFAGKLESITGHLQSRNIDLFINVRCDAFLLNLPDAREEAIRRIGLYEKTGVHGIFLPCITKSDDIKATAAATQLPLNVMCMPGLPGFNALRSLGVKRISMGNFLHSATYRHMEALSGKVLEAGDFIALF